MKKQILTQEGLNKIKEELRNLIDVHRPNIIKEIQSAREQGDLSENADYEAAKSQQTIIESRIQELQNILNNYQLIHDEKKNKIVQIGSIVQLTDLSNKNVEKYEIVGSFDTDPSNGKISNECPVAKAIIGHKVGETIEIKGVPKPYKVHINSIN